MGGQGRAGLLADKLGLTAQTKRLVRFLLRHCGNCGFRFTCMARLFGDKDALIEEYRRVFLCNGTCRQTTSSFEGGQLVKFLDECAGCVHLRACIKLTLTTVDLAGLTDATSMDVERHVAAIKRCACCEHSAECWSATLERLGFRWADAMKVIVTCKYKRQEESDEAA